VDSVSKTPMQARLADAVLRLQSNGSKFEVRGFRSIISFSCTLALPIPNT
jgi:hypothetical protein